MKIKVDPEYEAARHSRMALARLGDQPLDLVAVGAGRVALVGAGTTGSAIGLGLAAVGVGTVDIWDFDQVGPETLGRSVAYTGSDVGRPKATALAARMRALNPHTRARGHLDDARLGVGGARYEGYDVLILATDDLPSRVDLSALALRLPDGPVVIECGLSGFDWSVQVMAAGTACYGCALPDVFDDTHTSCNGISYGIVGQVLPTTLPAALGVAGVAITDTLLALCSREPTLLGRELLVHPANRDFLVVRVPPRPSCDRHGHWSEGDVLRVAWTPGLRLGAVRSAAARRLGVPLEEVVLTSPRAILRDASCTRCGSSTGQPPTYLERYRAPRCACGLSLTNTSGCRCGRPVPPAPSHRLECAGCGNIDPAQFAFERSTALINDGETTRAAGLPDEEVLTAWAGERSLVVLLAGQRTRAARAVRHEQR